MSQPDADVVDVELNAGPWKTSVTHFVNRHGQFLTNFESAKEGLMEAALLHSCAPEGMEKDQAQISALRAELLKLVEVEQEVNAHKRALQELGQNYQPSLARTDFKARLEEYTQHHMDAASFNPATCEAVREFDENADIEAEEAGSEELDEDGLMVVGGDQNTHCPISGKDVMLLTDPVQDSKGYVFSEAAIKAYFKGRPWIVSPVAGTSHRITFGELKPSKKILKAQRRARMAGPSQGRQGAQRAAEVVLEA